MVKDALDREESCGCHFRLEYQTQDNEAQRNDKDFSHVSAWERSGSDWLLHKEKLSFSEVQLAERNYK